MPTVGLRQVCSQWRQTLTAIECLDRVASLRGISSYCQIGLDGLPDTLVESLGDLSLQCGQIRVGSDSGLQIQPVSLWKSPVPVVCQPFQDLESTPSRQDLASRAEPVQQFALLGGIGTEVNRGIQIDNRLIRVAGLLVSLRGGHQPIDRSSQASVFMPVEEPDRGDQHDHDPE